MEEYIFNTYALCRRGIWYSKMRGTYSKWEQKWAQNIFPKSTLTKLNVQIVITQYKDWLEWKPCEVLKVTLFYHFNFHFDKQDAGNLWIIALL